METSNREERHLAGVGAVGYYWGQCSYWTQGNGPENPRRLRRRKTWTQDFSAFHLPAHCKGAKQILVPQDRGEAQAVSDKLHGDAHDVGHGSAVKAEGEPLHPDRQLQG